jgi:hypothetical protein
MVKSKQVTFFFFGIIILAPLFGDSRVIAQQQKKEDIPEPLVIEPGKKRKAPSDAIVLFDNGSLGSFVHVKDGSVPKWKVRGKKFTVTPKSGNIQTKDGFGDCQLHIEWKTPKKDVREGKTGQQCGNSGVYLMGKYEVQVLNSYLNKTYPDGQAGAIYSQHPPLVNASKKPGKWQSYDIIFTAPRFNDDGSVSSTGYFTVFHNGVLIQNHAAIGNPTTAYNKNNDGILDELPLMLQDHNNLVSYRNIWIRKL